MEKSIRRRHGRSRIERKTKKIKTVNYFQYNGENGEIFTVLKNNLGSNIQSIDDGDFKTLDVSEDGYSVVGEYEFSNVSFNDNDIIENVIFSLVGHFEDNENALILDKIEVM